MKLIYTHPLFTDCQCGGERGSYIEADDWNAWHRICIQCKKETSGRYKIDCYVNYLRDGMLVGSCVIRAFRAVFPELPLKNSGSFDKYKYEYWTKNPLEVLYVGVSFDPLRRMIQHAFMHDMGLQLYEEILMDNLAVILDGYDNQKDALEAERLAIREHRPRYNVVHNRDTKAEKRHKEVEERTAWIEKHQLRLL